MLLATAFQIKQYYPAGGKKQGLNFCAKALILPYKILHATHRQARTASSPSNRHG
jgi:hypothetical protein